MKKEKPIEILLENAQIGDKVVYKKQRGYVIGETSDGDLIIQIQGSTEFAKQKQVTVLRGHVNTNKPDIKQFKFDEKTQKVLFEQFVKASIYVGNTPVKTNNVFVKYLDYKNKGINEELNVMIDGELTPMVKDNIRLQEDPVNFANPEDYIEGVITEEINGQAIKSVLINVLDYTNAIGDADMVRIIYLDKNGEPIEMDNYPKGALKTLSI